MMARSEDHPLTPSSSIVRTGSYLRVDDDGIIIKSASLATIQSRWRAAIEMVVAAFVERYQTTLHSMYVRGSVAKGEAIDGRSDLDAVVIFASNGNETIHERKWEDAVETALLAVHPFICKLDVHEYTLEEAMETRSLRIAFRTQTVCVHGTDLAAHLPPLCIGWDAMSQAPTIQMEIADCIQGLGSGRHVDVRACCAWIAKQILRAGFELVMERERRYTRDLYPCYESFVRHYPHKGPAMHKVLELAINPTADRDGLVQMLLEWLVWLPDELTIRYGTKAARS
jgi:predicted nucleotidyltransferase